MIRDPYIGMPIIIGDCCGNNNGNPGGDNTAPMPPEGGFDARLLGSLPIAMAYTPMQQWKTTYSPEQALNAGTVFPELDLPFQGGRK